MLTAAPTAPLRPHILSILADDLGWANTGLHTKGSREVQTPSLDALVAKGIALERHYAYKLCSPSRSAFQTGRLPVHVNDVNAEPTVRNPNDPFGGYAGIPVNMTGLGHIMQRGGYRTHFVGKWDVGMATQRHTPRGRGYQTFFGYFHHANDYWTEGLPIQATGTIDVCHNRFVDLWEDDGSRSGPAASSNGTAYEEELFANRSLRVIHQHDATAPLFLVHAFHLVHTPLQVPKAWLDKFAFIDDRIRRSYAAMTHYLDHVVGRLIDAFRSRGFWDSMLVLFTADNGGPIYFPAGGNNHPLKGGKYSDWEGGVRVSAFLAGGALPPVVQGTTSEALCHIADWYATFASLAGVNATDTEAGAVGLPPIDSVNLWPALVTGGPSAAPARTEIQLSTDALISGRLKLIRGKQHYSGWTGQTYPNRTGTQPMPAMAHFGVWDYDCGARGCLFDIFRDPTEHMDLAAAQPADAVRLGARLDDLNAEHYGPDRGRGDEAACTAAVAYGGFYGPFC